VLVTVAFVNQWLAKWDAKTRKKKVESCERVNTRSLGHNKKNRFPAAATD